MTLNLNCIELYPTPKFQIIHFPLLSAMDGMKNARVYAKRSVPLPCDLVDPLPSESPQRPAPPKTKSLAVKG